MKSIIMASKNSGKIEEFKQLFSPYDFNVHSLLDLPETLDVEETGTTFRENARLKAETIAQHFQTVTIADDSGLVIDALDGRPGVYSARYAGEEKNDLANIEKVLKELKGTPMDQRTARFYCVLAIASPTQKTQFVEGTCDGFITEKMIGDSGFGYDPIFYYPKLDKTLAQLTQSEKNQISHRANAMKKLKAELASLTGASE